jgi:hypothetical protein
MKQKDDYQQDLASIRDLMDRSVKFISLSGLSGILAGIYALMGAAYAYVLVYVRFRSSDNPYGSDGEMALAVHLVLIALLVLAASLFTGWLMSWRKSKALGISVWNDTSKRLVINLAIPLVSGGLLILVIISRGYWDLVAGASLIFYGLALLNASSNLYKEIRYLGYAEILLGLICAAYPGFGLLFWAVGFGALHVVYGAVMYRKYDK